MPMYPLASTQGANSKYCQLNKKASARPKLCSPNAARRYTYVPPEPGKRDESSAHTSPSHNANSAPAIHAVSASGPPSAASTNGMVMSGPMPIIVITLIATAPRSPIARCMGHGGSLKEGLAPAEKPPRNVGGLPTSVHVGLTLTP